MTCASMLWVFVVVVVWFLFFRGWGWDGMVTETLQMGSPPLPPFPSPFHHHIIIIIIIML